MVNGRSGSSAMFINFEVAPKRVQLSLSEKNTIAALHTAGLIEPSTARETEHPMPTIYGVFKRFKQRGAMENEGRDQGGHLC